MERSDLTLVHYEPGTEGLRVPVMLFNFFDAAVDAGGTAHLVGRALRGLESEKIATVDVDSLIDFRAQRPLLVYENGHLMNMAPNEITIQLVTDVEGTPFVLVTGEEPDFRWDTLVKDLLTVVNDLGVERIYSVSSFSTPVPHTRPAALLVRTTPALDNPNVLDAKLTFPASFTDYFEFAAGQHGIPMMNTAVRVPIYLVTHIYPQGAIAALDYISREAGLSIPLGDLEELAAAQRDELTALAEDKEEFAHMVASFEEDFDSRDQPEGFVIAENSELSVPTSEEIGRAVERFLAGQADKDGHSEHTPGESSPASRDKSKDKGCARDSRGPVPRRRRGRKLVRPADEPYPRDSYYLGLDDLEDPPTPSA